MSGHKKEPLLREKHFDFQEQLLKKSDPVSSAQGRKSNSFLSHNNLRPSQISDIQPLDLEPIPATSQKKIAGSLTTDLVFYLVLLLDFSIPIALPIFLVPAALVYCLGAVYSCLAGQTLNDSQCTTKTKLLTLQRYSTVRLSLQLVEVALVLVCVGLGVFTQAMAGFLDSSKESIQKSAVFCARVFCLPCIHSLYSICTRKRILPEDSKQRS